MGSAAAVLAVAVPAPTASALSFTTAPHVPSLPTLALNGSSQTLNATMNGFAVGLGVLDISGFNITVAGDSTAGRSGVFKVYCPGPSACGSDPVGYVSGGSTLAAGSLTLNSTGASWSETFGLGGSTPSFLCGSGCALDTSSPVKVASQGAGVGVLSTWTAGGFGATSIALAAPTTVRAPKQPGEVYHLDLVWTLGSGP